MYKPTKMETVEEYLMLIKAKKELKKIEFAYRSIDSDFMRYNEMWEFIAMQINSYKDEELKLWSMVMDLFKEKYK